MTDTMSNARFAQRSLHRRSDARPARTRLDRDAAVRAAIKGAAVAFCGVVPVMLALLMLWRIRGGLIAFDLHHAFRPAAEAVLNGHSPYPSPTTEAVATRTGFVYLPFASVLYVPFALMPPLVADLTATILMVAVGGAALWLLGVRDWRCYGIALWWPPVLSAIQTANVTLPLVLALAAVWVTRKRPAAAGLVLALTLATKLFLWPVLIWFLATRRYRPAATAVAATIALVVGTWAMLGFAGAREYPELLRVLAETLEADSYTPFALVSDLGAPEGVAHMFGLALATVALVACCVLGRRGDDERSFTLAILSALLFTPIVWLHYFALLLVPLAILHRRLTPLWAVPLVLWAFTSGFGNGTTAQTALTLATVGAVAGFTLRRSGRAAPGRTENPA